MVPARTTHSGKICSELRHAQWEEHEVETGVPGLPLSNSVTAGEVIFMGPFCKSVKAHLSTLLWGFNETVYVICIAQRLGQVCILVIQVALKATCKMVSQQQMADEYLLEE